MREAPKTIGRALPAARQVLAPIVRRPPLAAFAQAPDPIDDDGFPGDPEGDVAHELDSVKAGFRDRAKNEADRFKNATDGGYYFVAVFETSEQVTAYLKAIGMSQDQTGAGDLFIDGRAMADRQRIAIPAASVRYNAEPKIDPKLSSLARRPPPPKARPIGK